MDEMIAYCGLACRTCAIYLATREQDPQKKHEMRVEIARQINNLYKETMEAADVTDCDGCRTEGGRLFSGCNNCKIRRCATRLGIENCAHCDEYACEELQKLFATDPDAKRRLDQIRGKM